MSGALITRIQKGAGALPVATLRTGVLERDLELSVQLVQKSERVAGPEAVAFHQMPRPWEPDVRSAEDRERVDSTDVDDSSRTRVGTIAHVRQKLPLRWSSEAPIYAVDAAHITYSAHIADTRTDTFERMATRERGAMFVVCQKRVMNDLVRVDAFGSRPPRRVCKTCERVLYLRWEDRYRQAAIDLVRDLFEDAED